ncbi:transforming acidic coiled-coil-containing protein 1 isoform X2 [Genypterus blacodes]|uniref:transforming acidic coiled-coil-containing protein 1 isoform X2 n=1 Tax=Genypterus blacodes TaxID=154954 RepID=UPI003F766455
MGGTQSQKKSSGRASTRSHTGVISDSDGHFDTPATSPVHTHLTVAGALENNNTDAGKTGVEQEEHLMVIGPVGDQGMLLNENMGQEELVAPLEAPLEISIQAPKAEQTQQKLPEVFASVPAADSPSVMADDELNSTAPAAESFHESVSVTVPELVPDLAPAPAPAPAPVPTPDPVPTNTASELPEETHHEGNNGLANLTERTPKTPKTKTSKSKHPPLEIKVPPIESAQENEEQDLPVPVATYKFDPDQFDDSFNPFTSGGSKIQNSPPPCGPGSLPRLEPLGSESPVRESSFAPAEEAEKTEPHSEPKPAMLEFSLDEGKVSKPPPRKLGGKKTHGKLSAKKQRPKGSEASCKPSPDPTVPEPAPQPASEPVLEPVTEPALPGSDPDASLNLDDMPLPKTGTYNFNPDQWDDPNFNPFGSNNDSKTSAPSKGSYSFDPAGFDESADPFKPTKSLSNEDSSEAAPQPEKRATDGGKQRTEKPPGERRVRQIPKKSKDRTNTCKAQKYEESPSLGLDLCNKVEEEEEVVVQEPEISEGVHYATDEEKLASTAMGNHRDATQVEPGKINQPISDRTSMEVPEMKIAAHKEEDVCSVEDDVSEIKKQTSKVPVSEGQDGGLCQENIPLSEMDKAEVLTLIREEIFTKEMEANEWKRKFEESRTEVMEMRKIVAEYEKTVAQMIEDEQQQKSLSGNKTVRQLSAERDQAVADLNSVERSFSDLFRRYENMKTVLEGFKKNEDVLKKCAQEYLMRIKQEEQRYQTLKMHAEEKLDKANEEIAQVRSKANSESVALNASLRKEQMKVDSLERAVQQKNQEIEELTKICDELIAKLGPD